MVTTDLDSVTEGVTDKAVGSAMDSGATLVADMVITGTTVGATEEEGGAVMKAQSGYCFPAFITLSMLFPKNSKRSEFE